MLGALSIVSIFKIFFNFLKLIGVKLPLMKAFSHINIGEKISFIIAVKLPHIGC